jgi:hypothetical protein
LPPVLQNNRTGGQDFELIAHQYDPEWSKRRGPRPADRRHHQTRSLQLSPLDVADFCSL